MNQSCRALILIVQRSDIKIALRSKKLSNLRPLLLFDIPSPGQPVFEWLYNCMMLLLDVLYFFFSPDSLH